ncbi:hypothetical protein SUGI_0672260 [Cryptomeria japonica]|uniref:disease resistance protein Roq1-like n=1 Tax=Cryptomeria japonica TaxID=3369 RepID=UPI0024147560|nr:disease resistance protein Roq1-like [Cryptomeria japonica]GLJ33403.1 hypothetical protein SUGI_0672260 [Cryptomeria japonica]
MASTSSSGQQNAFSGIDPYFKRRPLQESSSLFDVFINHRGSDVISTLATQLCNSLERLGIRAFLDEEEMELGDYFSSTLKKIIRSAKVHIAIFSKRYAEAPWCLAKLVLMLQSETIIIPMFYEVNPSDLRYIEKGSYADAFNKYIVKGRYTEQQINKWKEAIHSVSFISGYIINDLSDFNCENIVSAVQKHLVRSQAAKYPVGLSELAEELEKKCLPGDFERQYEANEGGGMELTEKKESHFSQGKALIVGIYGMGGAGKTTLSKELFNRHRSKFIKASFLADVRETFARGGLPSLQLKLLRDLFDDHHLNFQTTEEGTSYVRYAFQSRRDCRFLIVLDDIDRVQLLDDLLDLDNMNPECLVIVTTRNEQVITDAEIDCRYKMKDMSPKHSRELFCWHAFRQKNPPSGYEELVDNFVEVSGFLPLSLQIFGGLVRDKIDGENWHFFLNKVREQLNPDIKALLQISVDTLDGDERQMFMDIACFFIGKPKAMAINIWEGCRWKAQQALQNLERKSLVHIAESDLAGYEFDDKLVLKMHDHVRDLGRQMADNQSFPRRNWHFDSLESNGFENILRETSSRCLNSFFDTSINSEVTYFLGNLDQTRPSLLWLELELDGCEQSSLPSWIPLQHLRSLRIFSARLNELWQNSSQAPVHLKELVLHECSLAECTNSLGMLKDLEKLVLTGRNEGMIVDGRALSESLRGLTKLQSLVLRCFTLNGEFTLNRGSTTFSALTYFAWVRTTPRNSCMGYFSSAGEAELISYGDPTIYASSADRCISNLQSIEMRGIKLVSKVSIGGEYCPNLESLHLDSMENLIQVDLTRMRILNCLELRLCELLKMVSGNFDLPELVTLKIVRCGELEELPSLENLRCLEKIVIDGCGKLQNITGVEELQEIRCLHLSGDIVGSIHNLEKLPSRVASVIGKASHQAMTILDANQFCNLMAKNTNTVIDIIESGAMSEKSLESLSTLIICAVVRGSYASGTNAINIRLPSGLIQSNIGGGVWVVTIAITGEKDVADYKELLTVEDDAQIKKQWMVPIKKDEEGNALQVFKTIISLLYQYSCTVCNNE